MAKEIFGQLVIHESQLAVKTLRQKLDWGTEIVDEDAKACVLAERKIPSDYAVLKKGDVVRIFKTITKGEGVFETNDMQLPSSQLNSQNAFLWERAFDNNIPAVLKKSDGNFVYGVASREDLGQGVGCVYSVNEFGKTGYDQLNLPHQVGAQISFFSQVTCGKYSEFEISGDQETDFILKQFIDYRPVTLIRK